MLNLKKPKEMSRILSSYDTENKLHLLMWSYMFVVCFLDKKLLKKPHSLGCGYTQRVFYVEEGQNLSSISLGDNTFEGNNLLSILSPEKIGQLNLRDRSRYCTSFKCVESNFLASGRNSENSDLGMNIICSSTNSITSSNSCFDNLVLLKNSSLCFSNSTNKNSGARNSNLLNRLLRTKTLNEFPLLNNDESKTFTSITTSIFYKYFCDKEALILSENSPTSFSLNSDLLTILCNRTILSNFDFITLLTNTDQSISDVCLINFNSSGILTTMSFINLGNENKYKKLSISGFELQSISDVYSAVNSGKEAVFIGEDNNQQLSSFLKSFVLNTSTEDCFLKLGSLDQIAQFNFNTSANIGISLSYINLLDLDSNCLNDLFGITFTKLDSSDSDSLNFSDLSLEYFNISDSFFFNSSIACSGVNNAIPRISEFTIINLAGLSLKNESNIFVSTTNCIFYHPSFLYLFHIPSLILSPSFKQSSSVNSEFSSILSNFLSNKALLTFSDKNLRIDSDTLSSGSSSNCFFNSSGMDKVMFGILLFPGILNSVYSVKDVQIYKSFSLQSIAEAYSMFNDNFNYQKLFPIKLIESHQELNLMEHSVLMQ